MSKRVTFVIMFGAAMWTSSRTPFARRRLKSLVSETSPKRSVVLRRSLNGQRLPSHLTVTCAPATASRTRMLFTRGLVRGVTSKSYFTPPGIFAA